MKKKKKPKESFVSSKDFALKFVRRWGRNWNEFVDQNFKFLYKNVVETLDFYKTVVFYQILVFYNFNSPKIPSKSVFFKFQDFLPKFSFLQTFSVFYKVLLFFEISLKIEVALKMRQFFNNKTPALSSNSSLQTSGNCLKA